MTEYVELLMLKRAAMDVCDYVRQQKRPEQISVQPSVANCLTVQTVDHQYKYAKALATLRMHNVISVRRQYA